MNACGCTCYWACRRLLFGEVFVVGCGEGSPVVALVLRSEFPVFSSVLASVLAVASVLELCFPFWNSCLLEPGGAPVGRHGS